MGGGEPAGLDTLEEPPERRGVGHVGGLGFTRMAGKHATDTATDVGDDSLNHRVPKRRPTCCRS